MRPVINLKILNRLVCKNKFKMEIIGFAVQLINEGDYMASIHIKDAYFSIPIHVNDRKYLRFMWFWCLTRNIFVIAVPIPGQKNIPADNNSRNFNDRTPSGAYTQLYTNGLPNGSSSIRE